MRILLDECVDPRVKTLLPGFPTSTVHEKAWDRLKDGPLLAKAQDEFDAVVTIDRGLEFQQNLAGLRIVIVHVARNRLIFYRQIQTQPLAAIARIGPRELIHVRENTG